MPVPQQQTFVTHFFMRAVCVGVLLILLSLGCHSNTVSLPSLNININDTSVSGLSSGGYMAVQMHIAFSSIMKGAGK